jgi:hypothetical protein
MVDKNTVSYNEVNEDKPVQDAEAIAVMTLLDKSLKQYKTTNESESLLRRD